MPATTQTQTTSLARGRPHRLQLAPAQLPQRWSRARLLQLPQRWSRARLLARKAEVVVLSPPRRPPSPPLADAPNMMFNWPDTGHAHASAIAHGRRRGQASDTCMLAPAELDAPRKPAPKCSWRTTLPTISDMSASSAIEQFFRKTPVVGCLPPYLRWQLASEPYKVAN